MLRRPRPGPGPLIPQPEGFWGEKRRGAGWQGRLPLSAASSGTVGRAHAAPRGLGPHGSGLVASDSRPNGPALVTSSQLRHFLAAVTDRKGPVALLKAKQDDFT